MGVMFTHPDAHFLFPVQHDEHCKAFRWARFLRQTYGIVL